MTSSIPIGQVLEVGDVSYRIAEHPSAPGMPYGQEGRQATVYQLHGGTDRRAMKILDPIYRVPSLVPLADGPAAFVAPSYLPSATGRTSFRSRTAFSFTSSLISPTRTWCPFSG